MSIRTYDSHYDKEDFLEYAETQFGAVSYGVGFILDNLEYRDKIMLVNTRETSNPERKYMLQLVESDGENVHVYLSDETLDQLLLMVAAVRTDTQDGAS